jgi:hypothetical protein
MTRLHRPIFIALALGAALALWEAPVAAKNKLSPAKVKQIKKSRKSFENCRRDALRTLKKGGSSKEGFELALRACKENFPGASLYVNCKKAAIRNARQQNIPADQGLEQCKGQLLAASFDPDRAVPFYVDDGKLYFAGIGLNAPMPTDKVRPPNFDCDRLGAVARAPAQAQYLLFGNHPRVFAGLSEKKGAQLMQALGMTKSGGEKGVDVQGFGRVFGDPKAASGVVYFPAGNCDFDAEPGKLMSGLSAYYLIDALNSSVSPYFGIAYYRGVDAVPSTEKLVQAVLKELGPAFKTFKKNDQTTFIAAAAVSETDAEQDPKNLCKQPRQHRFVAVVQGRKEAPAQPEYMLVANVKNLCDFGDKMSKKVGQ